MISYIAPRHEFTFYVKPALASYRVATGESVPPSMAVQQIEWPNSLRNWAKGGWSLDDGFTRGMRAAGSAGKLTLWPQPFPWKQGPFLPSFGPQTVEAVPQPFPSNRIVYGGAAPIGAQPNVNKQYPWAVAPYNAQW
jgi:hypothetical protein